MLHTVIICCLSFFFIRGADNELFYIAGCLLVVKSVTVEELKIIKELVPINHLIRILSSKARIKG